MDKTMSTRLYNRPPKTVDTLKAILGGAVTNKDLAKELGFSPSSNAVYNWVHDPRELGLITKENGEYQLTQEARRIVQLDDVSVLEDPFLELPGVEMIQNNLENDGPQSTNQLGRVIAFETGSDATSSSAFRSYGQVYAHWFDFLGLGYLSDGKLFKEKDNATSAMAKSDPLRISSGANSPEVRPKKIFKALEYLDDADNKDELREKLDVGNRTTEKTLSTCYALRIAEKTRTQGFTITDRGKKLRSASKGNRKKILRDALLELPLVQAFSNRIPDGEFKTGEVMEKVSDDYTRGWSEGTIDTKSNVLYRWLLYTELTTEVKRGVLAPTDILQRRKISDP